MAGLESKSLDSPDETRPLLEDKGKVDVVELAGVTVGRAVSSTGGESTPWKERASGGAWIARPRGVVRVRTVLKGGDLASTGALKPQTRAELLVTR